MKAQNVVLITSVIAVTALIRQRFIGLNGGTCAAGAKALGVAEYDSDAGNAAPANVLGVILVEAGAPVAAMAEVQSDANGYALDAAVADGDLIRIVRGI